MCWHSLIATVSMLLQYGRKLKTSITSVGFFEEAIATPSMKAALEAWGTDHNLFQKGFAKETTDPAIVIAGIMPDLSNRANNLA
jgi:hypothetical protein